MLRAQTIGIRPANSIIVLVAMRAVGKKRPAAKTASTKKKKPAMKRPSMNEKKKKKKKEKAPQPMVLTLPARKGQDPDFDILFDPYARFLREMWNSKKKLRPIMHPCQPASQSDS